MSHRIHNAVCAILMIACSGVAFSQMTMDSDKEEEFKQAFYTELQTSGDEMTRFGESLQPLFEEMQKNVQARAMAEIPKRMANLSTPMTPEQGMRFGMEIAMEEMVELQKPINGKSKEFFTEEQLQKMHLRLFQFKEGLMGQLETTDNQDVTQAAFGFEMLQLMGGQPDFLDLSPEQRDLILKQQKDSSAEALLIVTQANMKRLMMDPGKLEEIQRLAKELRKAETDEERVEFTKKFQEFNRNMFKDIAPELRKILIKGHEDFQRVLTDAQKAKIKSVMADMPDYMKNLLAEVNKDGGTLSGLESWVPGMGPPGVSNPNREAPRQRSGGGRAFPDN